jgi:hypothetical protein
LWSNVRAFYSRSAPTRDDNEQNAKEEFEIITEESSATHHGVQPMQNAVSRSEEKILL